MIRGRGRPTLVRLLVLLLTLWPAACDTPPAGFDAPPSPALWRAERSDGARAWLFGTIHALPDGVEWRTSALDRALAEADLLLVEVADLDDETGRALLFHRYAATPGQPPLAERVHPALRGALEAALAAKGHATKDFAATESWAAALMLAPGQPGGESANGVDRALIAGFDGPVRELEGAERQFAIFDALPEREQRDMLEAVVREAAAPAAERSAPARAWRRGDMAALEAIASRGLLADPELREALLTRRNRRWARRVDAEAGPKVLFVAVGGAHMVGDEGFPALLARRGWRVARIG